jgi:hypothetical protein
MEDKKMLQAILDKVSKLESIRVEMKEGFAKIDERFIEVNERLDSLDKRVVKIERKLAS